MHLVKISNLDSWLRIKFLIFHYLSMLRPPPVYSRVPFCKFVHCTIFRSMSQASPFWTETNAVFFSTNEVKVEKVSAINWIRSVDSIFDDYFLRYLLLVYFFLKILLPLPLFSKRASVQPLVPLSQLDPLSPPKQSQIWLIFLNYNLHCTILLSLSWSRSKICIVLFRSSVVPSAFWLCFHGFCWWINWLMMRMPILCSAVSLHLPVLLFWS